MPLETDEHAADLFRPVEVEKGIDRGVVVFELMHAHQLRNSAPERVTLVCARPPQIVVDPSHTTSTPKLGRCAGFVVSARLFPSTGGYIRPYIVPRNNKAQP